MEERTDRQPHCIVLVFPVQGHINPLLQFSKRLQHKGVRVTLVTTHFIYKTLHKQSSTSISLESISDGFDEGGLGQAGSDKAYVETFWQVGPKSFTELLERLISSGNPFDCVVYDSFMPWALDIARKFGVTGAVFFTQSCAVNNIYYHTYKGNLKLPLSESEISLPGLPPLAPSDMPSYLNEMGVYPAFLEMVVNQFYHIEKVDWVLCNTFYELEQEVADWQGKIFQLRTIGPTIPSMFLEKRLQDDNGYGFSLFKPNNEACMKWLSDKPNRSVVYVSFGSLAVLDAEQVEEIAWGLKDSGCYFLWVVRASEKAKLPKDFVESSEKGFVVTWCPQLQVLEHEALGCFVTHCGWNSTLEALSLGVPMVAVPQWSDQSTNAKYIADFWKMGIKAEADKKGIMRREAMKKCIKEVLETERGKEMRRNAMKWKALAIKAFEEGGSSDKNTEEFVKHLVTSLNPKIEEQKIN
ncbi:hypothetical protein L6164_002989 [Bauhinia variegata]|uniref:Uncharacterized protein n=1 Tax=Bauhinia variegata TaxID=167791 RepID=A0ACB9PZ23_BAUVA|nr:hypothetical protein L6164_002989 [Bauhinia variegata]